MVLRYALVGLMPMFIVGKSSGEFTAALEADDACVAGQECALELAQLRAAKMSHKKMLADESGEDAFSDDAAILANKIHEAALKASSLKQQARDLRSELNELEKRATSPQPAKENLVLADTSSVKDIITDTTPAKENLVLADTTAHQSTHTSRLSAEDQADMRRLCTPERTLNFSTSTVIHSNLGGKGPDDGEESLVYQNVARKDGKSVDLVVTTIGDGYTPRVPEKNGVRGTQEAGQFGLVNIAVNTDVNLRFSFVDSETGADVTMDPFYFTVFDIDQGMAHESFRAVYISGFDQFKVSPTTELTVTPNGNDTATFRSSLRGGEIDNPIGPRALDDVQKDRTVTVTFPAVSSFDIDFISSDYAHLDQGRNWMFGGPSALTCGTVHNCLDFECPAGYHLRTMAEFLVCGGRKCAAQDRDICCYEE